MKEKLNLFKLKDKETKKVMGGEWSECQCGCAYVNCGGSSYSDNSAANDTEGKISPDFFPQC